MSDIDDIDDMVHLHAFTMYHSQKPPGQTMVIDLHRQVMKRDPMDSIVQLVMWEQ